MSNKKICSLLLCALGILVLIQPSLQATPAIPSASESFKLRNADAVDGALTTFTAANKDTYTICAEFLTTASSSTFVKGKTCASACAQRFKLILGPNSGSQQYVIVKGTANTVALEADTTNDVVKRTTLTAAQVSNIPSNTGSTLNNFLWTFAQEASTGFYRICSVADSAKCLKSSHTNAGTALPDDTTVILGAVSATANLNVDLWGFETL